MTDADETSKGGTFGDFIRSQRKLAEMSQRELAKVADLSDAYLSQLERGLHQPSVRVLNGLAEALNVPTDRLMRILGQKVDTDEDADAEVTTESAILLDDALTDVQKQSLLDIYRSFVNANDL
ncbi:helix-turn-helix domain-containing protein [Ilumatobacter nonamiensis]|uniref:helix-turn-helix domain-containing protein n=1 Tax=Ilumatobacter nonamiensis TaxID=467093 RepID=UPI00034918AD|nr:transcriptional regulator [Ilumatobacter nonamiensis]